MLQLQNKIKQKKNKNKKNDIFFKYITEYFIMSCIFLLYFIEVFERVLFEQDNNQIYIVYLPVISHKPVYQNSLLCLSR